MESNHRFVADADSKAQKLPDLVEGEVARSLGQAGSEEDEARPDPASALWNSKPDTAKWLAHHHVDAANPVVGFRIQGWLAERGTSVWFGAGSTGKTQLMLWMAAMLASQPEDRPEQTWLGGRIHGTGHVLILTAEDTREEIMGRLQDVITNSMGQDAEARSRTCSRLHIMPFLSMPKAEFDHLSPSLFQQTKERTWERTAVLEEINRYISEWNRNHDAEDRIIGVVMDSATSMSGFDSLDAQATTNFFFYLGRLCERLRIFWAIIGHTPKTTTISRLTYRETAPSRLRGVAMWTTAPRLTVEVRLVQDWRDKTKPREEAADVRSWLGTRVDRKDLLVVYVAKANLRGASRGERYLARLRRGAFVDVTDRPDEVLWSGILDKPGDGSAGPSPDADRAGRVDLLGKPKSGSKDIVAGSPKPGRPRLDPDNLAPGTDLVRELIHEIYPGPGVERVSANRLMHVLSGRRAGEPRAALVTTASGGGKSPARPGAINWHLDQLKAQGLLQRSGRHFHLVLAAPGTSDGSPIAAEGAPA